MVYLRRCLLILVLFFCLAPVNSYAEASLEVTGYTWRNLPDSKRSGLMEEYFDFYKLDRNKYSVKKGVESLDTYYQFAYEKIKNNDMAGTKTDVYFNDPTLLVFGGIVSDKENDWGIKQLKI